MICEIETCGGKIKIDKSRNLYRLNRRQGYGHCKKCGATYLLETRVLRMIKPPKKKNI